MSQKWWVRMLRTRRWWDMAVAGMQNRRVGGSLTRR